MPYGANVWKLEELITGPGILNLCKSIGTPTIINLEPI